MFSSVQNNGDGTHSSQRPLGTQTFSAVPMRRKLLLYLPRGKEVTGLLHQEERSPKPFIPCESRWCWDGDISAHACPSSPGSMHAGLGTHVAISGQMNE